jgi:PAS domain-containing protein
MGERNRTARLGYTYEDIVGKGIEFLLGLEHGEEAAKIVRRMASAGPARNAFHAIPLFAKDGRVIEAETRDQRDLGRPGRGHRRLARHYGSGDRGTDGKIKR